MSSGIASQNRFDLLGNDDEDQGSSVPTKTVEKSLPRTTKRDTPDRGGRGGGRGGRGDSSTGNEGGGRDRAGGGRGRGGADDGSREVRNLRDETRGGGRGRGRGSGGRGGRGRGGGTERDPRDDRHSKTGIADHEKQAAHGWGGQTGGAEWDDEKAGEAIAAEDGEGGGFNPEPEGAEDPTGESGGFKPAAENDAAAPEPEEDKTKSYDAWMAERAEKQLNLGPSLTARKPNEGASKKLPEGKEFERNEGEEFFSGTAGKAKRERQRKEKVKVELDDTRVRDAPQTGGERRGGRGGYRGDRGDRGDRGGDRHDRGDRGDRHERSERPDRDDRHKRGERGGRGGRGGGEGGYRGGEGRGRGGRGRGEHRGEHRGEYRGRGRGGHGGSGPNVSDTSAFPSLGS